MQAHGEVSFPCLLIWQAGPTVFPPMAPPPSLGQWRMAIRWRTLMKCPSGSPGTQARPLEAPAALHRWSPACMALHPAMHGQEQIVCGSHSAVDPPLAPLVVPSGSLLGRAACPNRDVRVLDSLLAKLHGTMATHACLPNSTAILSLHLRHLARQLQVGFEDPDGAGELLAASSHLASVMKENAIATGCSLASFWVARHHLWLSQPRLRLDHQDCLMWLPVDPTGTLHGEVAVGSRGLRRNMARVGRPRAPGPQPAPRTPTWNPEDLQPQLEAFHRQPHIGKVYAASRVPLSWLHLVAELLLLLQGVFPCRFPAVRQVSHQLDHAVSDASAGKCLCGQQGSQSVVSYTSALGISGPSSTPFEEAVPALRARPPSDRPHALWYSLGSTSSHLPCLQTARSSCSALRMGLQVASLAQPLTSVAKLQLQTVFPWRLARSSPGYPPVGPR
ncbi:hypothetical protein ACER0C_030310 [Sarotherodon galilaeus]